MDSNFNAEVMNACLTIMCLPIFGVMLYYVVLGFRPPQGRGNWHALEDDIGEVKRRISGNGLFSIPPEKQAEYDAINESEKRKREYMQREGEKARKLWRNK